MYADNSVYELFTKGDMEAMSILVEAHKDDLYNLCYRLTFNRQDAEDLFQQTWMKAASHASQFDHHAFQLWLFRICVNQYRDNYRHVQRKRKLLKDDFTTTSAKDFVLASASHTESAEDQFERRHIQALLVSSIGRLPEGQKLPVILYYYQHMKYAEIAGVLRVPEGTIKSRINTAKRKLKSDLERELYV